MASRRLRLTSAAGSVPQWRATRILLSTAIESSSLLGHDLIHRLRAERYQVFLSGHFALWASAAVVLPLLEYVFWYRAPYVLLFAAIGAPQCVALAIGLRLARLGRYSQSISLVCITNWISAVLVTVCQPQLPAGDGAGGPCPRCLRGALYSLATGAGLHRDHRGLRAGDG